MASKIIPLPTPEGLKKVIIKDEKPNGIAGGDFTSGSWRTRDLNTIKGDTSIITLSANQFTLQPGSYLIYGEALAYDVDLHQARLYSITTSSVIKMGQSAFAAANTHNSYSNISLQLELLSAGTFELQHKCQTTSAYYGLGYPQGATQTFAILTILKL